MARILKTNGQDPRAIMEARARYYDALKKGATKEEAARMAQGQGAAPTPTPAPRAKEPTPPPPSGDPDDLTQIHGVGPGTVRRLESMGISTLAQIADWSDEEVEKYDNQLNLHGRVAREEWVRQAKALVGRA